VAKAEDGHFSRPIVLVGFMGSGKSRIGQLLAKRLELPFADSDAEIAKAFGMPIAEIFKTRGEAEFRAAERRTISGLLGAGPRVIAIGGGAFVDPETRSVLLQSARTVWLDPPFEVISARVSRSAHRPLAVARSRDELHQLWEERRPTYESAHFRIETGEDDPERAVDRIVALLGD